MANGNSFSRASFTRPREGGHSHTALHRHAHACPDEIKFGKRKCQIAPCGIRNRGCPGANVEWRCPGLHLLKWVVVGAWCDVSDHLLLSFTVRASWRVHAAEVTGRSRKMVASMLSDLLNCPCLRLYRGFLIIGHLPRQSIRKESETSSQGRVNSRITLRLWSMCPCEG
ncbi:hypothetical protein CRG98_021526 [Punica granatum]|uniref:Uncharacterized protein n=1 Tax=Punica granatum TaxID=22663 RepID=A0A2I0JP88_PUNGR|nr:hypothetical protein CRG98_021526 [Punica granatum]